MDLEKYLDNSHCNGFIILRLPIDSYFSIIPLIVKVHQGVYLSIEFKRFIGRNYDETTFSCPICCTLNF